MRPDELSDDLTATAPVIDHALRWVRDNIAAVDFACCIYATAPFVQAKYLLEGYRTIKDTGCSSCYSVSTFPFPIFRASKINDAGCLEMFWPQYELTRSQDLPDAYHDAGQFYWVDARQFPDNPRLYATDSRPVLLPRHLVQDIDTLEDWVRAEYMYEAMQSEINQNRLK